MVLLLGGCGVSAPPPEPQRGEDYPVFMAWLKHAGETAQDSISASTAKQLLPVLETLGSLDYDRIDSLLPARHVQHNPMLPGDRSGLLDMAAEGEAPRGGLPRLMENTAHLLIEGELALIHRVGRLGPLQSLNFDVLRIDERGQLLEQWSFLQPVEGSFLDNLLFSFVVPRELDLIPLPAFDAGPPGGNPAYAEPVMRTEKQARENRALVLSYLGDLGRGRAAAELTRTYLAEDFQLHLPGLPAGREAMKEILSRASRREVAATQEMVIAQNDLVWVLSRVAEIRAEDVPELASADLFRVREGLIVEQWKVVQPSPRFSRNEHGLF
jgi:predicted SnoaL-like aldol condensation-catalyzing enzyme